MLFTGARPQEKPGLSPPRLSPGGSPQAPATRAASCAHPPRTRTRTRRAHTCAAPALARAPGPAAAASSAGATHGVRDPTPDPENAGAPGGRLPAGDPEARGDRPLRRPARGYCTTRAPAQRVALARLRRFAAAEGESARCLGGRDARRSPHPAVKVCVRRSGQADMAAATCTFSVPPPRPRTPLSV